MTQPSFSEETRRQAAVFDLAASQYEAIFGNNEAVQRAIEWLIQRLAPGSELLDAGSGTGIPTARRLSEAGRFRLRPNCSISANGQANRLRLRWQ